MSIFIDCILIFIIIVIFSILILSSVILSCFKVEDISDGLSVSSEGSTQSKEKRKMYITKMNTYINKFMKFEFPELNLKTYLKERKKYRNQYRIYDFTNLKIDIFPQKKKKNKKVTFQKEIEIEEKVF